MASTEQDKNLDQDPTWFLINLIMHTNSGKLVNVWCLIFPLPFTLDRTNLLNS